MVIDSTGQLQTPAPAQPVQKVETHEALDKALRAVQNNLDSSPGYAPVPPSHQINPSSVLKRHHSLPHQQQPRSVPTDNLVAPTRVGGSISSRTRRAHPGVPQYETPDEEDELLDEELRSAHKAAKRVERTSTDSTNYLTPNRQSLRQSHSTAGLANPYPTPSPSASGNAALFGQSSSTSSTKPVDISKRSSAANDMDHKWPTPPYEENEWAASAAASIFAVGDRF